MSPLLKSLHEAQMATGLTLALLSAGAIAGQAPIAIAQNADSRCLVEEVYASSTFAPTEEDNKKIVDKCITVQTGLASWYINGQTPQSHAIDPESEKAQQVLLRLKKYAVQQVIQIRYTCTSRQASKGDCFSLLKIK